MNLNDLMDQLYYDRRTNRLETYNLHSIFFETKL